jgi:hypothetical protein
VKDPVKSAADAGSERQPVRPPLPGASASAKRQAAAILEVLAGMLRPAEAAALLETSLPRYYLWEKRALAGLLAACEPAPRGPRNDATRRIAVLERENRRLQRECDRQQALVRAAERALGLVRLAQVKSSAKTKAGSPAGGGKPRKRARRPTVRALKASQALRCEVQTEASSAVPEAEERKPAMAST